MSAAGGGCSSWQDAATDPPMRMRLWPRLTNVDILPESAADAGYDAACRRCAAARDVPRRSAARRIRRYWCKPVPPFGDRRRALVIVGLAPGMHGANASGRPFTGDYAGILLYATLYAYGFASQPVADARDDGLRSTGCRITNAVKCLPPDNKPAPAEIRTCNAYLAADLRTCPRAARSWRSAASRTTRRCGARR